MARRDDAAFAEFVAARSGALHRFAFLMLGDEQLAQDLVQEALIRTYVALPSLRDPSNAEAYVRKVITNTAISWFRRKRWVREALGVQAPEAATEPHDSDVARRDWLWRALQDLPARQRASLVLRFYEDMTEAQVAEAMGCAVGTVKSQVSIALRKLRDRLSDDSPLTSEDLKLVIP